MLATPEPVPGTLVPVPRRGFGNVLKNVLESELHDARVLRCGDLAERAGVTIQSGISAPHAVRHVERFTPEFQSLAFANLECPRQRRIELPGPWAHDIV